ncbi:hypothetical protein BpHYR1_005030 [Brachionus plicatilis]|uniref:Uncharacterized protein n=1 Tax=Brachionus plicatilis TaxID=10195 RepID=A0A3M7QUE1_BRAPC|nr:hypothetical protein BpHYR1_005030 [Brachionus plicatilis]
MVFIIRSNSRFFTSTLYSKIKTKSNTLKDLLSTIIQLKIVIFGKALTGWNGSLVLPFSHKQNIFETK